MKKWIGIIVGSVLIGMVVAAVVLYPQYQASFMAILKEWKVVPLPEPLTELYFEDHLTLPSRAKLNDDISFRFTIHNIEYQSMNYPYVVKLLGTTTVEATHGAVLLAHDESTTIPIILPHTHIATRTAVMVDLPEKDQYIQFWVEPK